jgi:hypothetical protein
MDLSARSWWGKRRLPYNAGLVAAGMASLTLHAALLELSQCRMAEGELTPFTLIYKLLAYLAAMGLANLCYSLAPLVEARLHPHRIDAFRRWAFGLGFGVSVALPFVGPLAFLARCA